MLHKTKMDIALQVLERPLELAKEILYNDYGAVRYHAKTGQHIPTKDIEEMADEYGVSLDTMYDAYRIAVFLNSIM